MASKHRKKKGDKKGLARRARTFRRKNHLSQEGAAEVATRRGYPMSQTTWHRMETDTKSAENHAKVLEEVAGRTILERYLNTGELFLKADEPMDWAKKLDIPSEEVAAEKYSVAVNGGQYLQAAGIVLAWVSFAPRSSVAYGDLVGKLGQTLKESGEYADADDCIRLCEKLLGKHDDPRANKARFWNFQRAGDLEVKRGFPERAIAFFDRALELPGQTKAWQAADAYHRSRAYNAAMLHPEAGAAARRAMRLYKKLNKEEDLGRRNARIPNILFVAMERAESRFRRGDVQIGEAIFEWVRREARRHDLFEAEAEAMLRLGILKKDADLIARAADLADAHALHGVVRRVRDALREEELADVRASLAKSERLAPILKKALVGLRIAALVLLLWGAIPPVDAGAQSAEDSISLSVELDMHSAED